MNNSIKIKNNNNNNSNNSNKNNNNNNKSTNNTIIIDNNNINNNNGAGGVGFNSFKRLSDRKSWSKIYDDRIANATLAKNIHDLKPERKDLALSIAKGTFIAKKLALKIRARLKQKIPRPFSFGTH